MTDPYERVLQALAAHGSTVRRRGPDAARAMCPVHRDLRPSLSITRRHDRVLLKCFAGCRVSAIVHALDLRLAHLFAEPLAERHRPEIVAVYPYCDADGVVVAEKIRYRPKRFAWHTPDPAHPEAWRWGLHGATVGLYRLPELVDARRVLLVEGERAADRLRDFGVVATCGPAGASLWSPRWTRELWALGCSEVDILPDADLPGQRHAVKVATACLGFSDVGSTTAETLATVEADPWADWPTAQLGDGEVAPMAVKIVQLAGLPPGGDVVDWLDLGHTINQLREIVARTTFWSPAAPGQSQTDRRRVLARERQRRHRALQRTDRAALLAVA